MINGVHITQYDYHLMVLTSCGSCCLSEDILITCREVLSPKLMLGIGGSKTILIFPLIAVCVLGKAPHRHAHASGETKGGFIKGGVMD